MQVEVSIPMLDLHEKQANIKVLCLKTFFLDVMLKGTSRMCSILDDL